MNSLKSLSIYLAAGLAGAAFVSVGNAEILARVSGEMIMASAISVALLAFAVSDYARQPRKLSLPATVLRPALPAQTPYPARAYGIRRRSAIIERAAS